MLQHINVIILTCNPSNRSCDDFMVVSMGMRIKIVKNVTKAGNKMFH